MRALALKGMRVPAVLAQLEAAAHRVGPPRLLLVVASQQRRRAQPLEAPAGQRAERGRTRSVKTTIADTGLPGSPKTSVSPGVPNQRRLARLERHAPKALLDSEIGERLP